jgi:hypothetical protein
MKLLSLFFSFAGVVETLSALPCESLPNFGPGSDALYSAAVATVACSSRWMRSRMRRA